MTDKGYFFRFRAKKEKNPYVNEEPKKAARGFRHVRIKGSSLEDLEGRLLRILDRDTKHLQEDGKNRRLDKDGAQAVVNYLKMIKVLKDKAEKKEEEMTDEELERIAKDAEEKGHKDPEEEA